MSNKFAKHDSLSLSQVNQEILAKWMEEDLFHKSLELRKGHPTFVFFEGPPSANGHPGIHHVLARTIKDTVLRYKTMQGYRVPRKAGWDTHGLPVELGVEKELGITKEDIGKTISIEEYNARCRKNVMMYTSEWTDLSNQMGYWVDLDHPYITYDNKYIETLWYLLKKLYEKDLLYKGYTIQPYSPAAGTGLSSHELNQPGCYRDVKDTTVTALFRMTAPKDDMKGWGDAYFVAWTTTPWTLPSNTALCVGPKFDYVVVRTYNPYNAEKITIVLAEERLGAYLKPEGAELPMDEYTAGDKVVPYRVVGRYKGTDLVGLGYEQLMPWVKPLEKTGDNAPAFVNEYAAQHPEKCFSVGHDTFVELSEQAFRVISGDYVTTDDGTGIVHIAPTFGADDAKVAKAAAIPSLFMINRAGETRPMVDMTGKYYLTEDCAPEFLEACVNAEAYSAHAGDYVKNAYAPKYNVGGKYDEKAAAKDEDLNVVMALEMKAQGLAYKIEKHVHNYPHCWRTDKPVLYYPLDSWFIRSTALKERMSELNKTILWKPESTGTGRFGKWLENLNDWNLSRSRYWGTPLPIWRNAETREEICIGSVEELYNEIEKAVEAGVMTVNPLKEKGFIVGDMSQENYDRIDLHRPYVDDIVLVSPTGRAMKREADLIDVWFDSGAMPYAQLHYPFENREMIDDGKFFPANYIAEGVDQTRGWFFTLHALATMIFDSVAFKAVISNGLVLDKNGSKMSKRLGNAVDPFETIKKYGSDPVRWYMITNAAPWENLKFDIKGVEDTARSFFVKLHQTYAFLAMYANVDGFTGEEPQVANDERPEIDRWILSNLNMLVKNVDSMYANYELTKAGRLIEDFVINNLSNWYVRLNRKRFWMGGSLSGDKLSAFQCLYACLETVSRLMAPLAPFYADKLYRDLHAGDGQVPSVHLAVFPVCDESLISEQLEQRMEKAQKITSMVLSLRKKHDLIVRQPLQCVMIPAKNEAERTDIEVMSDLIKSEVNVKEIRFVEAIELVKTVKCNFRVMGKKFGKLMSRVSAAVTAMSQAEIAQLENEGSVTLAIEGEAPATIVREDVEIFSQDIPGWSVANEGTMTVALDLEVTDALRREGMAREIVKRIQAYRKDNGFELVDHIAITFADSPEVRAIMAENQEYVCAQVLCDNLMYGTVEGGTTIKFEGFECDVLIQKINR